MRQMDILAEAAESSTVLRTRGAERLHLYRISLVAVLRTPDLQGPYAVSRITTMSIK